MVTFTDGLVALYWLMASFSPSSMLMPSWAFAPVRAPKKPSLSVVPELAPPPLVAGLPPPLAVVLLLRAALAARAARRQAQGRRHSYGGAGLNACRSSECH